VTLYIVCFAAFQLLLHGYTGRTRIALWTQFSNRRRLAFQPVIGFFANPHIVGVDLSANPTATQVIGAVRTAMLEAFEHQELPLSLLLDAAMAQNTGLAQHPALGAAHLQFDLGRSFSTSIGALQIVPEALAPGPTELALQVHAAEQEGGLMLTARGRSSWLRPDAVHRVLRNLQDVLDLMSRAPETPASQFRTLVER
jgi:non-ribosomal peptide synthetase component F